MVNAGTVMLFDSIIAANQNNNTKPDIAGAFQATSAYNLIGNVGTATGLSVANQNQTGAGANPLDPLFELDAQNRPWLKDNGGTTPTHNLLPSSPALDRGCAMSVPFAVSLPPLTNDQRGTSRPFDNPALPNAIGGNGSDIGAVEIQAPTGAQVVVEGRVSIPGLTGRAVIAGDDVPGLTRAVVSIRDFAGNTQSVTTNRWGYFRFAEVEAGTTYIFTVEHKRYQFAPQIILIVGESHFLNFTALP